MFGFDAHYGMLFGHLENTGLLDFKSFKAKKMMDKIRHARENGNGSEISLEISRLKEFLKRTLAPPCHMYIVRDILDDLRDAYAAETLEWQKVGVSELRVMSEFSFQCGRLCGHLESSLAFTDDEFEHSKMLIDEATWSHMNNDDAGFNRIIDSLSSQVMGVIPPPYRNNPLAVIEDLDRVHKRQPSGVQPTWEEEEELEPGTIGQRTRRFWLGFVAKVTGDYEE